MTVPRPCEYHERLLAASGGRWFDFEGLVRDIYTQILKPGDTSLDVGVHSGVHFWQMLAAVGKDGLVLGVEAAPVMVKSTIEMLKALNMYDSYKFDLRNVAVSNKIGKAPFCFIPAATGLSSLARREAVSGYETHEIEVEVTTLDDILSGIKSRVKFAKLDIEGAEYDALLGGSRIFHDRAPIIFEFNKESPRQFSYEIADLLGLFTRNGYELRDLFGQRFTEVSDLTESGVWDYFAGPLGFFDSHQVNEIVLRSLLSQNPAIPLP